MTMKFMPGDEVRFLGYKDGNYTDEADGIKPGDTAIIERVWTEPVPYPYEAGGHLFSEDELELVE